ncbi:MAG: DNA helicase RecQ [Balneolaceae bacterium]|nr:MAG: DNA helicase RecQ [Balneolaceae bacterium]
MIQQARTILKQTFGYDEFRPLQQDSINNVLQKRDSMVIMPTGGGKSLIYQIPSIIFNGLTIVVSPLISLMKDQVEQLEEYGVPALYLNSTLTTEQYRINVNRIRAGQAKLLYLAPETLMLEKTRRLLSTLKVDCFTIDEAHCISEWGHDFRPEYRQLAEVRKEFTDAVCLALTATATPRVQDDIQKILGMKDSARFVASFDRKNLVLKVADKENPLDQILDFLYTRNNQSGIIYCFSRRQVDELAYDLKNNGHSALPYHAGLTDQDRMNNQDAFIRDDVRIIVATIAFGMGINKPDVRYVIHHDMPQNIESYYQQIGRAGRDGLKADCLLLYSYSDRQKIQYFINQKEGTEKEVAERHLDALINYLVFDGCRRIPLIRYFGESYKKSQCGMCDNCLRVKGNEEDYTLQAQKFLSCVIRADQLYGAYHIADVLRGSSAKKVLEKGHNKLSTYGIGKEWSKNQWVQFSRLLIRKGLVEKDPEHGSLILTENAKPVLKGDASVTGILDRTQTASDGAVKAKTSGFVEKRYNEHLFEELRKKRKELADEQDIPPYAIFPDTTLIEMSYYFPQDETSLIGIYGVGDMKLKKYGNLFLNIIRKFTRENNITSRSRVIRKRAVKTASKQRHELVGKEFQDGKTIDHLAEQFGVKTATILSHLKKYLEDGNSIDPAGIINTSGLSERKRDEVFSSMKKLGPGLLKPIYEDLDKEVDYNELRILQLAYLAGSKK